MVQVVAAQFGDILVLTVRPPVICYMPPDTGCDNKATFVVHHCVFGSRSPEFQVYGARSAEFQVYAFGADPPHKGCIVPKLPRKGCIGPKKTVEKKLIIPV